MASGVFLGEIAWFMAITPPSGWARCNGAILNVAGNEALYSVLGNIYGGSPGLTFGLPDARGRTIMHTGNGNGISRKDGEESHILGYSELPLHNHDAGIATNTQSTVTSSGNYLASGGISFYTAASGPNASLNFGTIDSTGGGLTHESRQPYTVMMMCINVAGGGIPA